MVGPAIDMSKVSLPREFGTYLESLLRFQDLVDYHRRVHVELLPFISIALVFATPSPPTQLLTSIRVKVYYEPVSMLPSHLVILLTVLVTPVVGILVS